jgi:hypothetical protein
MRFGLLAHRRWHWGRSLWGAYVISVAVAVPALAQDWPFVSLISDDGCPLRVVDARREVNPRGLDLVIAGTIANPTYRPVRGLVLTAALVDAGGRVTHLHMKPVKLAIEPRTDQSFRVIFEGFAPTRGERVAFGIQAVQWSRTDEWRGALKVVAAPSVLAGGGVIR